MIARSGQRLSMITKGQDFVASVQDDFLNQVQIFDEQPKTPSAKANKFLLAILCKYKTVSLTLKN